MLKGIKPKIICGWRKADSLASFGIPANGIFVNATEKCVFCCSSFMVFKCLSNWVCLFIFSYICVYIKKRNNTPQTYTKLFLIEFEQLDPAAKATVSLEESQTTLNVIVGVFFLLGWINGFKYLFLFGFFLSKNEFYGVKI